MDKQVSLPNYQERIVSKEDRLETVLIIDDSSMVISPRKHGEKEKRVSENRASFHTVEQLRWEVGTHSSPSSSINSIRHLLSEHFFSLSLSLSLWWRINNWMARARARALMFASKQLVRAFSSSCTIRGTLWNETRLME